MTGKARATRRAAGPQWTPEQVVELAVAHDLAELEIESMGLRVRVRRLGASLEDPDGFLAALNEPAED